MRRRLEKETDETKTQLTNELNGVKKLLEIEEQKGSKLREEITLRDELNSSLRYGSAVTVSLFKCFLRTK